MFTTTTATSIDAAAAAAAAAVILIHFSCLECQLFNFYCSLLLDLTPFVNCILFTMNSICMAEMTKTV